jgi:hypothetical protein
MSWSFNAIGKPSAVAAKARTEMEFIKCAEPEQSLKSMALAAIEAALSAMPDASVVKVYASGSQSPAYVNNKVVDGKFSNSFKLDIEPIWGFVE